MIFIEVQWLHDACDEPSTILSVLDDCREEISKYEFYDDNTYGFCNATISRGGTKLSLEPYPEIDIINLDDQFRAKEINYAGYSTKLFELLKDRRLRS